MNCDSKEFEEGSTAAESGISEDKNPYDPDDEPAKHTDWSDGWNAYMDWLADQ